MSGDLGLPLYFFTGMALIGGFLFTLSYLVETLKSLLKVVKKNES